MASLTLITKSFPVIVLAIFAQTCNCEIHAPSFLHSGVKFPKFSGPEQVVYVPVCTPDCFKSSPHHHQSHFSPKCPEKAHIGNLPLQDHGQTYHPHLDLGGQHQYQRYAQNQNYHDGSSASVYQQNGHRSSEQKYSVQHGHGVSQQSFKQEHGALGSQVQDQEYNHSEDSHHEKDPNIHYQYEYSVQDHKTGDVKRHREERKGDEVNGEYSLLEEDGNVRTVKYFADWKSGFHAQVHNSKPKPLG